MLLAIETSCDETAICLYDNRDNAIVSDLVSSQVALHAAYGGVVPELAAREHLKNLPILYCQIQKNYPEQLLKLNAIAVTIGPGLKGCLLVGLSFAKGLAFSLGLPLFGINHLEGHLLASKLLQVEHQPSYPYIALLVSGGHTMLVLVSSFRNYEILAETVDDAVGEAFDKCATLLGLEYPGGPLLSHLATFGDRLSYSLPKSENVMHGFSFSGLKTAFARAIKNTVVDPQEKANLAASVELALVTPLINKTIYFVQKLGIQTVLLTGGVAANKYLRNTLQERLFNLGVTLCSLPQKWCGDNAAMIAVVAAELIQKKEIDLYKNQDIEKANWLKMSAIPRFHIKDLCL